MGAIWTDEKEVAPSSKEGSPSNGRHLFDLLNICIGLYSNILTSLNRFSIFWTVLRRNWALISDSSMRMYVFGRLSIVRIVSGGLLEESINYKI